MRPQRSLSALFSARPSQGEPPIPSPPPSITVACQKLLNSIEQTRDVPGKVQQVVAEIRQTTKPTTP